MKRIMTTFTAILMAAVLTACAKENTAAAIPDFTGLPEEEIREWAGKNEIQAEYAYLETDEYEEGTCLYTEPESLNGIEKGSRVTFIIAIRPGIEVDPDPTLRPADAKVPEAEKVDADPNEDSRPVEEPVGN